LVATVFQEVFKEDSVHVSIHHAFHAPAAMSYRRLACASLTSVRHL